MGQCYQWSVQIILLRCQRYFNILKEVANNASLTVGCKSNWKSSKLHWMGQCIRVLWMSRMWIWFRRYNAWERAIRFVNFWVTNWQWQILVKILPVVHPVYKVSLEFYIWSAQATWENVFHFTLGTNTGTGHRHPTLFIIKEGNRVKLHVTAYVNGDPNKTILPIVDKNTWISLEYGIVWWLKLINKNNTIWLIS